MADPNIHQAIKLAKAGEPAEMKNSIYAALTKKVGDALEVRRQEVASNIVKTTVPEESVEDTEIVANDNTNEE